MKNINSLTGQEFEKLVYDIFTRMGFRSQLTKTSGDGGIDIIAHYDGLVFKGKYLIQCKRWISTVGEPELRDLYGTTVAENALKGILVTTSTFSRQALEFAKGKNLELIDGSELSLLIESLPNSNDLLMPIQSETQIGFQFHQLFDKNHYLMLDKKIRLNPMNEMFHNVLIDYLFTAILEMGKDALNNGLIDECNARLETYKETFCKGRSREKKGQRRIIVLDQAVLLFIKGQLSTAYELIMILEHLPMGTFNTREDILKYVIAIKLGSISVANNYANRLKLFVGCGFDFVHEVESVVIHNQNLSSEAFENIILQWPRRSKENPIHLKQIFDLFGNDTIKDIEEQRKIFKMFGEH